MIKLDITPEQALANIDKAVSEYRGSRTDHQALLECIKIISDLIQEKANHEPKEQ